MAALDFPNTPTLGQQYSAPNGAVYTWDGAAWTVSGVLSTGSAAGGDLSGSYPNPTVVKASGTFTLPGVVNNALQFGSGTAKGRLIAIPGAAQRISYTANQSWDGAAWQRDDAAQPGWRADFRLDAIDTFYVNHISAAGVATTPLALDGAGTLILPTTDPGHALQWGSQTAKARLIHHPTVPAAYFTENHALSAGAASWLSDDATKPSWALWLRGDADNLRIVRAAAGAPNTMGPLLTLDNAGSLTIPGGTTAAPSLIMGSGTMKGSVFVEANGQISLVANNSYAPWDATKASWHLYMNPTSDTMGIARRGTNQPVGSFINYPLMLSNVGDLTIAGAVATKASGTAWVAASDPRLKRDMAPYTVGLEAVLQLVPITFKFNGRGGTTDDDRQCWGFDASEVRGIMPECVGTRTATLDPDDETPTEILTLDVSNMLLALVNAVKEVAGRVAALEAA